VEPGDEDTNRNSAAGTPKRPERENERAKEFGEEAGGKGNLGEGLTSCDGINLGFEVDPRKSNFAGTGQWNIGKLGKKNLEHG